ncbi:MAG: beta-galactosidase [Candidatus Omnitrophota bacterium]|nr:beta-galactosidase [Candidatus Omnitrophota bacterium]MDZ4241271.1 beta-galactosidase [Candidatus Omnitrophota bacterium]
MKTFSALFFFFFFFCCPLPADEGLRIGTTFSRQQCIYLGLDWQETYLAVLKLKPDIIRLGAYWNEIEAKESTFDLTTLDWEIKEAKKRGIPIVLTIGMKAPRWPEYFIPAWVFKKTQLHYSDDIAENPVLKKYTLRFIREVINHYSAEEAIAYIQVENEALNKFGKKNWQLSKKFLSEEIELIRSLDNLKRPIVLTAATYPNTFLRTIARIFTKGDWIKNNLALCDILGINAYPTIGQKTFGFRHYVRTSPEQRKKSLRRVLKAAKNKGAELWVTELQAEPWEPGELVHTKKHAPPSISPETVVYYFEELKTEGVRTVLLWGAEYWFYQKKEHGNLRWWKMAEDMFKSNNKKSLAE